RGAVGEAFQAIKTKGRVSVHRRGADPGGASTPGGAECDRKRKKRVPQRSGSGADPAVCPGDRPASLFLSRGSPESGVPKGWSINHECSPSAPTAAATTGRALSPI